MSVSTVNSAIEAYQYKNKAQKTAAAQTSFTEQLKDTAESSAARIEEYTKYLKSKYGNVSIRSVGKDQQSLERVGKSMSGNDVIIAPTILEQMANDPQKAFHYEQKIDHYFKDLVPQGMALCAARGLVFEPGGVVVHEDGSVTYISGCSDSPERVAKVKAINKAKREKRAEQQRLLLEHSQKAAELQRQIMESYMKKQTMAEGLESAIGNNWEIIYRIGGMKYGY